MIPDLPPDAPGAPNRNGRADEQDRRARTWPAGARERLVDDRVRAVVASTIAVLDAEGVARDASRVDDRLERLFALSPYVLETCERRPDVLRRLIADDALGPHDGGSLDGLRQDLHDTLLGSVVAGGREGDSAGVDIDRALADVPEAQLLSAMRTFRHRHMVRILWREFEGSASLDDTLGDLTRLAEVSVGVATRIAETLERRRAGTPRDAEGTAQRLIVLGMGKLGGGELNVSSDIDLIFLFPAGGRTDGRRATDNGEHFARVARRVTKLLGSVTADGFAFRVDTRLRPFGESGPLAMSLDAFEHYLLTQGRDWERYAMIKARALTGEAPDIAHLESLLRPFVYRRYVDYDALVSLADLKRKIRQAVATRRDRREDVKLGSGGIREIEFTGQALQLMRGGREPRLQIRPIREVLATLGELGLMPPEDVTVLREAYDYLRRVENALQGMRDEQTHVLPDDETEQLRLVALLGEPQPASFRATLDAHRAVVARCFDAVLGEAGASDGKGEQEGHAEAVLPDLDGDDAAIAWLGRFGVEAADASSASLAEAVLALAGGPFHRRLTARAQGRVEAILPRLAAAAARTSDPSTAIARGLAFVRAVAGRSGYLQALADRPAALNRLVRLFGASEWVATLVTRHPVLLDELIGQSAATLFTDAGTIREAALAEASRLADADLERQMEALRQFHQARELRIAAAALEGELPPMQASDRLSWLAEAMIAASLALVRPPLVARYGDTLPELVVIAYGKLGGLELGFGSDLDLVFLRSDAGDAEPAARLVRRFVHFMATVTPGGRIHEIDLRLRPNGNSGVLVGTLESFAGYQRQDAWTWEHQALLRSRAVHGPAALTTAFEALRLEILCREREEATLRREVASMRERMRTSLGSRGEGVMHLKQDAGGVADIEFIVQYLALRHAAEAPSVVAFADNVRVLEAAGAIGLLAADDVNGLRDDYVELRERLHRRALDGLDAVVPTDAALDGLRRRVIERRTRLLDPPEAAGLSESSESSESPQRPEPPEAPA